MSEILVGVMNNHSEVELLSLVIHDDLPMN